MVREHNEKKITNEHEQLTQGSSPRGGWSRYLVLAGAATTLGCSLPVGYNIGVINTPAKVLKHFVNGSVIAHYDIALDDTWLSVLWSSVVSIFIVGGCTGSILGALLADNLGRRKATVLTSVISVIGAVIFLVCQVANSVELLILGRLIVGLSAGLTTSIVPMYLSELAPPALTGAMGVACPMGVNVGVLVGQVMGLDFLLGGVDLWPYLLAAYAVLVIICIPFLFILPESPKYLYVVKREEEFALQELSRLRGMSPSILTEDLELLREEVLAVETAALSGAQRWSMLRVLRDPRLRLLLLLTCTMQAGQQTSGINAVFYYSDIIFTNAGLSRLGAQYATIGCGAINVCTAILMVKLLPLWGRRPLLLSSIAAATVLLFALAVSVRFLDAVAGMPYVCMVTVFGYVLVYGFGLGPIPYFIASEMFEVPPRPAGMAWGSLANWGGNFMVGMSFPVLRDAIGAYSFLVFAAVTAALFVFQRFYFPETRGKTPQQITQLCSRGFRSKPLASQFSEV
ncbi:solute carrier family 2, facilitated glucose transporter member 3-like isoform X2 [Choristoneura fumiferana]|uniref:solute carrier family 2, facilitated glucose transporter member 3-like isoform X2 n=1 Tax=Choristoneura fumiferana TaxID=7141 RepID=UPI003D15C0A3